jgi:hypothetical protein
LAWLRFGCDEDKQLSTIVPYEFALMLKQIAVINDHALHLTKPEKNLRTLDRSDQLDFDDF